MRAHTTVYDLGEMNVEPRQPRAAAVTRARPTLAAPLAGLGARGDLRGSLSLLVPGTGQMLRGELTVGLFFLSGMAFLVSLTWALLDSLARVTETLVLLEQPPGVSVWTLGVIYVLAAALHMGAVVNAARTEADDGPVATHPIMAGIASAMLPGWGQVLNRDRFRAAVFVGSLWMTGAFWILASAPGAQLLESMELHLPLPLVVLCSTVVRWALPAVLWTLAIYDAVTSATHRR